MYVLKYVIQRKDKITPESTKIPITALSFVRVGKLCFDVSINH